MPNVSHKLMFKNFTAFFTLLWSLSTFAEDEVLAMLFSHQGIDGTIVISSLHSGKAFILNNLRANQTLSTASTFNIQHSRFSIRWFHLKKKSFLARTTHPNGMAVFTIFQIGMVTKYWKVHSKLPVSGVFRSLRIASVRISTQITYLKLLTENYTSLSMKQHFGLMVPFKSTHLNKWVSFKRYIYEHFHSVLRPMTR